jgi:polysaccharide pyruvyl transferase WcaK-like protein
MAEMVWPDHAAVLKGNYTPGQIMSLIGKLEFVIGMRLHFLLFAALQGVPFSALPYSPKILGLLEDLQLEAPPLHVVTPGRLIAHIDRAWDQRAQIREKTKALLPEMKKRAQRSNSLFLELLRLVYTKSERSLDQMPQGPQPKAAA